MGFHGGFNGVWVAAWLLLRHSFGLAKVMEVCRGDALKKTKIVSDAVDDGETLRVVRDGREVDGGTEALLRRGRKCSGLRRIRVRRRWQGGLMLSNGDATVDVGLAEAVRHGDFGRSLRWRDSWLSRSGPMFPTIRACNLGSGLKSLIPMVICGNFATGGPTMDGRRKARISGDRR
ncbi:uncharacterized protein HKW66_Vig0250190 [Vigna angularis]|uniref:Uncharacterized protein n=1 Tax=Phaseolus angularis TaxID=3914 RepID=A0A8T0KRG0_PHAAN|nr:uncharacterized protein HKW66_Vig0250190 [Vigna angularis]